MFAWNELPANNCVEFGFYFVFSFVIHFVVFAGKMSEQDQRQSEPATRVENFRQKIRVIISQEIKKHVMKAKEENAALKVQIANLERDKQVQMQSITEYHKQIGDFREAMDTKDIEINRLNVLLMSFIGHVKEEERVKIEPEILLNENDGSAGRNDAESGNSSFAQPIDDYIEISD